MTKNCCLECVDFVHSNDFAILDIKVAKKS